MNYKYLSELDEIALKLRGMATVMMDCGDHAQASALNKFAGALEKISEECNPVFQEGDDK